MLHDVNVDIAERSFLPMPSPDTGNCSRGRGPPPTVQLETRHLRSCRITFGQRDHFWSTFADRDTHVAPMLYRHMLRTSCEQTCRWGVAGSCYKTLQTRGHHIKSKQIDSIIAHCPE